MAFIFLTWKGILTLNISIWRVLDEAVDFWASNVGNCILSNGPLSPFCCKQNCKHHHQAEQRDEQQEDLVRGQEQRDQRAQDKDCDSSNEL